MLMGVDCFRSLSALGRLWRACAASGDAERLRPSTAKAATQSYYCMPWSRNVQKAHTTNDCNVQIANTTLHVFITFKLHKSTQYHHLDAIYWWCIMYALKNRSYTHDNLYIRYIFYQCTLSLTKQYMLWKDVPYNCAFWLSCSFDIQNIPECYYCYYATSHASSGRPAEIVFRHRFSEVQSIPTLVGSINRYGN